MICCDLTNRGSFDKVKFWVEELLHNEDGCDIYVVGTNRMALFLFLFSLISHSGLYLVDKIEDGRECEVREEDVAKYAESIGAQTFRVSAKTGAGVEELFYKIAEDFTRRSQAPPTVYNPVRLEDHSAVESEEISVRFDNILYNDAVLLPFDVNTQDKYGVCDFS